MTSFELKNIQEIESKPTVQSFDNDLLELGKETPTSVISVDRQDNLNVDFTDPKTLEATYMTVPEIARAIDLRGSAIIYRGYEVTPADDSEQAKKFANICSWILDKSGGVNFFEQWQKNADLYGNGYVELTDDSSGKITELEHVSPFQFGYELTTVENQQTFTKEAHIKLDKDSQKPVGYATYKYNETDELFENDKKIPLERIAHLKYKLIGDALLGVSLIQPMQGSIVRKLKCEDNIEAAVRLVSSPKIVIEGDFGTDEEAREQAKEAASLDANDVVIMQDGKKFQFVSPGKTDLPALREIFVVNITTASGVPRPILTSESSEINKSTMQELMRQLRENMRSNMAKMRNIAENKIFLRIGQSYGITDFERIVPMLTFPEDPDTEEEIIVREEKKAATLTSLSNNLAILNNILNSETVPSDSKEGLEELFTKTIQTYNETLDTFTVNNDQIPSKKEEDLPDDVELHPELVLGADQLVTETESFESLIESPVADSVDEVQSMTQITLLDEDDFMVNRPEYLEERHDLMHLLYEQVIDGAEIFDSLNGNLINIPSIINKHKFYIRMMQKLGMVHETITIGTELDETVY